MNVKSIKVFFFAVVFCCGFSLPASAQIYFYLQPDAAKAKAAKAGFAFSKEEKTAGDTLQLIFYKSTDASNKLTITIDPAGFCSQFSYTLPAQSVITFHKNLSTNFTQRDNGLWESREKNFLLRVEQSAGITTAVYLPYTAP